MSATTVETKEEVVVVYFSDGKILDSQRIEQVGKELQDAVPSGCSQKAPTELQRSIIHVISDDQQACKR